MNLLRTAPLGIIGDSMKVAIYTRVSTDDKEQDPETQLMRCRSYCEFHDHRIIAEFKDQGIGGNSLIWDRPKGAELKKLIDSGKIEALVVFSIDRYSRQSPVKVIQQIDYLAQMGVKMISVTEPVFDMSSEYSEPLKYLLAWFSNYFLTQHKKKVKAGMEKAKAKGTKSGKSIGRPKLSAWHRNRILEMHEKKMSVRKIAKELGLSVGVVHKILKI